MVSVNRTTFEGIAVMIRAEVERAESLHSKPSFVALVEEVGEVAQAIQGEPIDAYCDELSQVACVAIRLIAQAHARKRLGANYPWPGACR